MDTIEVESPESVYTPHFDKLTPMGNVIQTKAIRLSLEKINKQKKKKKTKTKKKKHLLTLKATV